MEILLEILVGGLIILTIFLLFKLKTLHINAESLKAEAFLLREQLNHEHTSSQTRETNLHNTISGLQATISDERKLISALIRSIRGENVKKSMEIHWNPWNTIKSIEIHRNLMKSIEIHRNP